MARYSIAGNKGTTSVRTIINARAASSGPVRGKVYDYMVGNIDTPADNAYDHELIRSTTAGTQAANNPNPLDPAEGAALSVGSDTYTVDPSFGVVLMRVPLNQRATYRWVAAPCGELVWPATANNGICGAVQTATTANFSATLMIDTA